MNNALNEYCDCIGDYNYSDDKNWIDRFISWNERDLALDEDGVYTVDIYNDVSTQHHISTSWICRSIER